MFFAIISVTNPVVPGKPKQEVSGDFPSVADKDFPSLQDAANMARGVKTQQKG